MSMTETLEMMSYCPDSEVSFILGVCGECAKAKALDAGQDIVGGLGPAERFGVGIGGLDVSLDGFWWFFRFEKPALWLLSRCIKSVFSHPVTLQFPASMIKAELEKKTDKVKMTEIPKGKFVLQFGFKVPSFLTPAMPFAFEAIKKEFAS